MNTLLPPGSSANLSPATPALWVAAMYSEWGLIEALLRRTDGMRERGEKSLPKFPKESQAGYKFRLANSTCHGFFVDAVCGLAARPFEKPVKYQGKVPEELAGLFKDTNGEGCSIEQFSRAWLERAEAFGVAHVYVDYSLDRPVETLAEERQSGARPVFKLLPQNAILDGEVNSGGQIAHLRIKDLRPRRTGYVVEYVAHVMEWNLVEGRYAYKLHAQQRDGAWIVIREQQFPLEAIPLATINLTGSGRFQAEPPLKTLAEIEEQHWRTQSDHSNTLSIVSAGGIFVAGINSEEHKRGFVLGPAAFNSASDPNAKATWLEPRGEALGHRATEIARLESRMRELGARPLTEQAAARTATEVDSGDKRARTVLQSWVQLAESAITDCFRYAGLWLKVSLPEDFRIDLFSDWAATTAQDVHLRTLDGARGRGDLDQLTYLGELQRRGVLNAAAKPEDIKAAAKAEMPEPPMPGIPDDHDHEPGSGAGEAE